MALERIALAWRRTPTSPVVITWINATAVVPSVKTTEQRAHQLSPYQFRGTDVRPPLSLAQAAWDVRSNDEKPARAVQPEASCCAVVKANPTANVTGMTTMPLLRPMILAKIHGVKVSLPGPHSYASHSAVMISHRRCVRDAARKSPRIASVRSENSGTLSRDVTLADHRRNRPGRTPSTIPPHSQAVFDSIRSVTNWTKRLWPLGHATWYWAGTSATVNRRRSCAISSINE